METAGILCSSRDLSRNPYLSAVDRRVSFDWWDFLPALSIVLREFSKRSSASAGRG